MNAKQKINLLEVRKANLLSRVKTNSNVVKKIERKIKTLEKQLY